MHALALVGAISCGCRVNWREDIGKDVLVPLRALHENLNVSVLEFVARVSKGCASILEDTLALYLAGILVQV